MRLTFIIRQVGTELIDCSLGGRLWEENKRRKAKVDVGLVCVCVCVGRHIQQINACTSQPRLLWLNSMSWLREKETERQWGERVAEKISMSGTETERSTGPTVYPFSALSTFVVVTNDDSRPAKHKHTHTRTHIHIYTATRTHNRRQTTDSWPCGCPSVRLSGCHPAGHCRLQNAQNRPRCAPVTMPARVRVHTQHTHTLAPTPLTVVEHIVQWLLLAEHAAWSV